jgi:hypothetical protein
MRLMQAVVQGTFCAVCIGGKGTSLCCFFNSARTWRNIFHIPHCVVPVLLYFQHHTGLPSTSTSSQIHLCKLRVQIPDWPASDWHPRWASIVIPDPACSGWTRVCTASQFSSLSLSFVRHFPPPATSLVPTQPPRAPGAAVLPKAGKQAC